MYNNFHGNIDEDINRLGAERWELVGVYTLAYDSLYGESCVYVFKRPV